MIKKRQLAIGAGIAATLGLGGLAIWSRPSQGVVETYAKDITTSLPSADQLPSQIELDGRMLANVLGSIDALETQMRQMNERFQVSQNANEGLYTVEQERHIAQAYAQYLAMRKALFSIAFRYKDYDKIQAPELRDQAFLLAYASGLTLYRNAVVFVMLFKDQPNARKKLNEANPVLGIPANTLDELYANITTPANVKLVIQGVEDFNNQKAQLKGAKLLQQEGLISLIERLERYEQQLIDAYKHLSEGQRDIIWTRVNSKLKGPAYQAQSMVSMLVGHIRSPLYTEGLSPSHVIDDLQPQLKPGDIILTRRDGYLSNTFLPGNWGHAAMYIGTPEQLKALGSDPELEAQLATFKGRDKDGHPFTAIEAIGEGVRFSSIPFALHADMVAVVRPKVAPEVIRQAITRAIKLRGVPYDFSFDLSSQDKIICTELVYRAYAPHLEMSMEEVMGRKTLKPDGLLRALNPGEPEGLAEMVFFGNAVNGKLQPQPVEDLMATVAEAPK